MGTSSRDMENPALNRRVPGPGEYSSDNSRNKTLNAAPKWGMGTGKETKINPFLKNRSISPGPGNYNTSENLGRGAKYSFGGKNKPETQWLESIPGPGQYNNGT